MPVLSASRSSLCVAVSAVVLSGLMCGVAQAQSRPDLDALVYGAATKAAAPVQAEPQVVVQQAPQVAPRGLFTSSSSSAATSYSGGALSAIGGMFARRPRAPAQPLDAQAAMTQPAVQPAPMPMPQQRTVPAIQTAQPQPSAMPPLAPRDDLDSRAYGAPADPVSAPAQGNGNQRGLFTGARSGASSGGALAALGRGFRSPSRGSYGPAPVRYAPLPVALPYDPTYRIDAGDRLRIVVYGQDGLTNSYQISAAGSITMPLIGGVPARGRTPAELAGAITGRLRDGFIREPSVAVEIEAYRPFFILGEVAAPGQYPYVPHMSVESAIAIAGGFSPRAKRDLVTLTHAMPEGLLRANVPVGTPLSPGDTIMVGERWF